MDKDEFESYLQSDEGKQIISNFLEKEVSGLKNKKDELLGSLKKEKEERRLLSEKLEALNEEKKQIEIEKLTKEGDVDNIKKELHKKYTSEIERERLEKDSYKTKLYSFVVDQNITEALVKNGVAAPLMEGAKALLTTKYKVEVGDQENGSLSAMIDGRNVNDFISEWSQGDTGKYFVSAANNSGGSSNGANGGGKATGVKTMTREAFSKMSPAQQSDFSIKGGSLVDS